MTAMDDARPPRIGIYGPFGWGNLGDASIQEAMMHHIRRRFPHAEIIGFSLNPDDTEEIHGIRSFPILRTWSSRKRKTEGSEGEEPSRELPSAGLEDRIQRLGVLYEVLRKVKGWAGPLPDVARELRFLVRARAILRDFDFFIVSGGGQLADFWGGPWYHPYTLLKWVACARLAGARVCVVSVGAGPIRSSLSGFFLQMALRIAHYRSYRDVESHELLDRLFGFTRRDPVYPDLAFSLPHDATRRGDPREGKPAVGISPLSYYHPVKGPWPQQNRGIYETYLSKLRGLTTSVLDDGHRVVMFSSQIRNDRYAFDDLLEELAVDGGRKGEDLLEAVPTEGLQHVLSQISSVDLVITSRLHGVILSYMLHKPVIALSYQQKIKSVMKQFGQLEYCLDIEEASLDLLQSRFRSLVANLPAVTEQITRQALLHRDQLDVQYDRLYGRERVGARP